MTTPEGARRLEALGLCRPDITPTTLRDFNDFNMHPEIKRLSKEWQLNKANKELWIIITCGDSRLLIPKPEKIISMRSIDLGGTKAKDIFLKGGAKLAVAMGHFGYFTPGKMPEGCGGGAAKIESINNHSHIKIARLQHYIDKKIEHPDVLVNAILNAKRIFEETGMPSIAVGENHRTGRIYPLAIYTNETYVEQRKFNLTELQKKYNEAEIYTADEIPFLSENDIPPSALKIFKEFLDACEMHKDATNRKYPKLEYLQEVQNPKIIAISDKLSSIRTRYDGFDLPNFIFKLHLTRNKDDESKKTEIDPEVQKDVIAQALYAITLAVEHYRQPNESFSETDTILIETSNINNSRNFAKELTEEPEVKKWLNLDQDHRIIVIQNKEGISNIIEYYNADQLRLAGV